jgi:hypothetical protein
LARLALGASCTGESHVAFAIMLKGLLLDRIILSLCIMWNCDVEFAAWLFLCVMDHCCWSFAVPLCCAADGGLQLLVEVN